MKCYNNDDVADRTLANAFLEFYERYQPDKKFIDSALYYLEGGFGYTKINGEGSDSELFFIERF